jgi:hypothetical protein
MCEGSGAGPARGEDVDEMSLAFPKSQNQYQENSLANYVCYVKQKLAQ